MTAKLISIIGPIGVGKTTLADHLATELEAKIIHEDYDSNPFLTAAYAGDQTLQLPSQLYFLMTRARQLTRENLPETGIAISDYGFCQDIIYARKHLSVKELETYESIANKIRPIIPDPEIIIKLDADVPELMHRIHNRQREFEKSIQPDFLEYLRQAHIEYSPPKNCKIINVDCQNSDMLNIKNRDILVAKIKSLLTS